MKFTASKYLLLIAFIFSYFTAQTQNLVIEDNAEFITESIDSLLRVKLKGQNIKLTSFVDYREKCNYKFARLFSENNILYTEITDCENAVLGTNKLGESIKSATEEEKATLIYFSLLDIIENPQPTPALVDDEVDNPPQQKTYNNNVGINNLDLDPNVSEHDSRYFFAPSAIGLKKDELYYNTIYFLLHDLQYGLTDRLTIGVGTTIIGLPFYLTAKLAFPLNEKSHVALGDLLIVGTYGTNFVGNLVYGSYTYGSSKSNFTIGLGLLTANDDDIIEQDYRIVTNANGILAIGKHFYILTENYITPFKRDREATRRVTNPDGSVAFFQQGNFTQQNVLWFGLSGIRFVTKSNSLASFQFGLTHIFTIQGKIPSPYDRNEWGVSDADPSFVFIPTISFTRKFKLN